MVVNYIGIITILIALICYYSGYSSFRKNRYSKALIFLIIGGLTLRIFSGLDLFLHDWDEQFHALVAKNMIQNPFKPMLYSEPLLSYDYRSWTSNHVWLHKQPLPLWTMAISMSIFGVNEIALRLPSILISTTAIYFTFYIGSYFYNEKVGLLAAFFHSIHGLIIELTGGRVTTDHIDTFFFFFIELSIFLGIIYAKKKHWFLLLLTGVSIGAGLLSKWLPGLITLPVIGLLFWTKEKMSFHKSVTLVFILLIIAMSIALPWQVFIHQKYPLEARWENMYNWQHFTTSLEGHDGSFFYHFDKMRIIWGELIYLPLLYSFYIFVKKNDVEKSAIFCWIFIPYIFFSVAATKMQGYILFTGPAIFIVLSNHCVQLMNRNIYLNNKTLNKTILILLITLPIRYSFERLKPFQDNSEKAEQTNKIKYLGEKYNSKKTILFNSEQPIKTMFYTDIIAYTNLPEKKVIEEFIEKDYKVIISTKGTNSISTEILSMSEVVVIN